jgi:hypothetical protein
MKMGVGLRYQDEELEFGYDGGVGLIYQGSTNTRKVGGQHQKRRKLTICETVDQLNFVNRLRNYLQYLAAECSPNVCVA